MADLTTEVRDSLDKHARDFEELKGTVTAIEAKIGDFDPAAFEENAGGELKEKLAKVEAGFDEALKKVEAYHEEAASQKRLVEEMEAKLQELERSGTPAEDATGHATYDAAYYKYLRGGNDEPTRETYRARFKLADDEIKALQVGYKERKGEEPEMGGEAGWVEAKNLSTDSGETGGYAMPAPQRGALVKKLIEFSPMEELANVETLSIGDTYEYVVEAAQNFVASWTNERASRAETQAGQLRTVPIVAHEAYANPYITQKALDDPAIDLAKWTNERLSKRFGVLFGTAYCTGDSDGKPEGIAVNSTAQTNSVVSGHASALTGDGLVDLYIDLPDEYARNGVWVFRRATLGEIWKLKDGQGNWLFAPGNTAGPPTVLQKEYREFPDMPAVGANTYPIGFGDWKRAYTIVRRQEFRQLRDPYTQWPLVSFKTTARRGGAVVLDEAYRLQKVAAS